MHKHIVFSCDGLIGALVVESWMTLGYVLLPLSRLPFATSFDGN